ncbi:MAG TPA: hypothetical protein VLA16_14090 [Ideonella sp.]|nr:hypothetical protein [Ideonella sp.]
MQAFLTRRALLLSALVFAYPAAASAQNVELVRVGPIYITDISADGSAATGQLVSSYETVHWTAATGLTNLGRGTFKPLRKISGTPGLSDDGLTVAATILDDTGTYATSGLWTAATGWTQLTPPLPPGGGIMDLEDSAVFGISGNGKVVTGLFWRPGATDGSAHGSRWSAKTGMADMGSDGNSSRIDDANGNGSVLAGWDEHPQYGTRRAAVWVNGVKTVLDNTDWPSEAAAVNRAGTIVVGQAANPARDFEMSAAVWKWDGSAWQVSHLGLLPNAKQAGLTYANGVSEDGSVVVGMARRSFLEYETQGFIWTAEGGMVEAMQYLKQQGVPAAYAKHFRVSNLVALSRDGLVIGAVGQGTQPPYAIGSLLIKRSAGR